MDIKGLARDAVIVCISVAASAAVTYGIIGRTSNGSVVRTSRVELLDGAGKLGATLAVTNTDDGTPQPQLRFIDRDGRSRIELGVRSGDPYFIMADREKRVRIGMQLDPYGNPALAMLDHQAIGRLLLGTGPNDMITGPQSEWGLYVNPSNRRNHVHIWVSGEWYSGKERAGVDVVSADKDATP